MTTCPWYISARAVREYLELTGRPAATDGPEWDRAERELMELAEKCAELERLGIKQPQPVASSPGLVRYRGPRPLRLNLVVSTAQRPEGGLPQLVNVVGSAASDAARRGPRRTGR